MAQVAEKLSLLLDVCEGLKARVYYIKQVQDSPGSKPQVLVSPEFHSIRKILEKRFPEQPVDREKAYEAFVQSSSTICSQLEETYHIFLDVLDWKTQALEYLLQLRASLIGLSFTSHETLVTKYMDLLCGYMQIHFLWTSLPDHKLMASLYSLAYRNLHSRPEPSYSSLASYMVNYEHPMRHIHDDFRDLSLYIADLLVSLSNTQLPVLSPMSLRDQATFNPYDNPSYIALPTADLKAHTLMSYGKFTTWICYGFLACPSELYREDARAALRSALQLLFALPVYRSESVSVHELFYDMFKWFPSKAEGGPRWKKIKLKDFVAGAAELAVTRSGLLHREMRAYLRDSLERLVNLAHDTPGLLAPKLNMVLAAMAMARSELLWYFRHTERSPPRRWSKGHHADHYTDPHISHLVFHIDELCELIGETAPAIRQYHARYLAGPDTRAIAPLVEAVLSHSHQLSSTTRQLVTDLATEVRSMLLSSSAGDGGEVKAAAGDGDGSGDGGDLNLDVDFTALRMKWLSTEISLATSTNAQGHRASVVGGGGNTPQQVEMMEACSRITRMRTHTRAVDQLSQLVHEVAGLQDLAWHYPLVNAAFLATLQVGAAGKPARHCMAFIRAHEAAARSVHPLCPEEQGIIGGECARRAQSQLDAVVGSVERLIRPLVVQVQRMSVQHSPVQAARRTEAAMRNRAQAAQGAGSRLSAAVDTQPLPGFESRPFYSHVLGDRREILSTLNQLCWALDRTTTITVFNTRLCPRAMLRARLSVAFRRFIRSDATVQEANGSVDLRRPSLMLEYILYFVAAMQEVATRVNVDVSRIVREVLLEETMDASVCTPGTVVTPGDGSQPQGSERTYIYIAAQWYVHFLNETVNRFPSPGVVYSAHNRSFLRISTSSSVPYGELWTGLADLRALALLVGAQGIRLIERSLLQRVAAYMGHVKEVLLANGVPLRQLISVYGRRAAWHDSVRSVTRLEEAVHCFIAIGNVLALRGLMRSALDDVQSSRLPFLQAGVALARDAIPHSSHVGMDCLAADIGLGGTSSGQRDHALQAALAPLKGSSANDSNLWSLLPPLCAACMASDMWRDRNITFVKSLDAMTNNAHTMGAAMHQVIAALASINPVPGADPEAEALADVTQFVAMTSSMLLNMKMCREKFGEYPVNAMVLTLEKFVDFSPLLDRRALERHLPYSVILSANTELGLARVRDNDAGYGPEAFRREGGAASGGGDAAGGGAAGAGESKE